MSRDEQDARRIAQKHAHDADPVEPPLDERVGERAGTPNPQTENAPGASDETRGTAGVQGRPRHPPDESR